MNGEKLFLTNQEKNVLSFQLNPSINDLLNNRNLYKLYVDDKLFLVPRYNEVRLMVPVANDFRSRITGY